MNPYEVLGVPPTASEHQIKSAYRRRARETHPDAGGDGDEFALVSRAYHVLMNPEARKRFDETGSIDEIPALSVRQRMIMILAGMLTEGLNQLDQQQTDLRYFDLMAAFRSNLATNLKTMTINRDKRRKGIADRQYLLAKITRKGDGQNVFADILRQQITEREAPLRQVEIDVEAVKMAIDEAAHYKSEVELMQAVQMMQYGGNYASSTTSNRGGVIWVR